jgi:PAS domain S-box-containing protein
MVSKASILIVEDSFIVAYHLKTTLESEGYHVLATQDSGEGALEFMKRQRPDLVLMDIMLNGLMDGVETARIIKLEYNVPIIYITALTDRDTIQRAKITEPYGYLTKPFEDREIFTVIEMALYKHNIESRLRKSEEKYFATVKSISDAVVVLDQNFTITYMNPSAEQICDRKLQESLGKQLFALFDLKNTETGEYPVNPVQCLLDGKNVNAMPDNLVLIRKDKTERNIGEGSLSPILDAKEKCIGMVMIFKDITQKIAHESLLRNFEKERLAALLEGQEKERSRIAKDLHDGLGQMLTAIKMNITLMISQDNKAQDLLRLIDEAVQESVRISENLLPSRLKDFDLATCINTLCNQIHQSTRTRINFDALGETVILDQQQKIHFFRIAQEAINNAIKHAQASYITVQLTQDENNTILTVEDDGKGIPTSQQFNSLRHGLANMRDRAHTMGGKLSIESDTNRGTLIIAEAPYEFKAVTYE